MGITFGDYLIDSGYRLREALTTLKHARVFISSREKMHPTGISLYDELVEQIDASLTEGK